MLRRASAREFRRVVCAVSGGTDSVLAAYLAATLGPEYGIEPDCILHANSGIGIPQTQLVAQVLAAMLDLPYIEGTNGTTGPRVLARGWPAATREAHFYERIERKSDVFDALHGALPDEQLWVSGARATESKQRSLNVPDSGVEADGRRARQTWCSPCAGLTSEEKWDLIIEHGLPVSESYDLLGISGECLACCFDDGGLLTDLDILAPNLAWAIRCLTGWLYLRARRGDLDDDIDFSPKQLCWGWDPRTDDRDREGRQQTLAEDGADAAWVGCNAAACGTRDVPDRVADVPSEQIVDRRDVDRYWAAGGIDHVLRRVGR